MTKSEPTYVLVRSRHRYLCVNRAGVIYYRTNSEPRAMRQLDLGNLVIDAVEGRLHKMVRDKRVTVKLDVIR